jgi:protein-S-isoprenylcysteine O-methyltransferase Ste14
MPGRSIVQKRRRLITTCFAFAVTALILFSGSRWNEIGLEGETLFAAGLVLVAAAIVGRLWCSLYICGYKTGTLVTVGPYSLCRHPLYFFSFLGALGIGLCTETITIAAIMGAAFLVYYPFVIAAEERGLRQVHGAAFEDYVRRTPKFWPALARLEQPEEYTVRSRIYARSIRDAMVFLWIVGGLEIAEGLHGHHMVPVFLHLY